MLAMLLATTSSSRDSAIWRDSPTRAAFSIGQAPHCGAGSSSQTKRCLLLCGFPLPRLAGTPRFAAAMPHLKIMVNQSFKRKRRAFRPGRNGRYVLVTRQFFPSPQAIVNHSQPSFRGEEIRGRAAYCAPGQGRMAKAKKTEANADTPEAEGE